MYGPRPGTGSGLVLVYDAGGNNHDVEEVIGGEIPIGDDGMMVDGCMSAIGSTNVNDNDEGNNMPATRRLVFGASFGLPLRLCSVQHNAATTTHQHRSTTEKKISKQHE